MPIAINVAEAGEFSLVEQFIGTTSGGKIALVEKDVNTGKIRARPMIVKDGFIYAGEVNDG